MEGISGVKSQGITKAALTRERIWEALEEMKVEDRNEFYIEGHKCSMDDVEKINDSLIQEIKSKNNTITIEKGKFYGVRGADGRKWAMRINKNGDFRLMHSESLYAWDHGEKCKEAYECWGFIRALSVTSLTVAFEMEYKTPVEVDRIFQKYGIRHGFFTIRVGERSNTFFYSREGKIYAKQDYDNCYRIYQKGKQAVLSYGADYMDLRRARAGRRKVWESA